MSCVFTDNNNNNSIELGRSVVEDVVGTSLSLVVISVVCPVPVEAAGFHLMRLERTVDDNELQTPLFPVCRIHLPKKATPEFNLTMCTATDRSNRMHVVEWMEYYKLLGVQQFVVYNLLGATEHDRQVIHINYKDYIDDGLLRMVNWSYPNCFKKGCGMAAGRTASFVINSRWEGFDAP